MNQAFSLSTLLIMAGIVLFVVVLNLILYGMAKKSGKQNENFSTAIRRITRSARSPFETEDKMMAELHERVSTLKKPEKIPPQD